MSNEDDVRLDKWLWAARFFKTRSLAKHAIEAGHVRHEGERCKVAKSVAPGMLLTIRRGTDEMEVEVLALSEQRRGAPEAALLYRETEASGQRRADFALQRKASGSWSGDERPTKKDRRLIHRFKRSLS